MLELTLISRTQFSCGYDGNRRVGDLGESRVDKAIQGCLELRKSFETDGAVCLQECDVVGVTFQLSQQ